MARPSKLPTLEKPYYKAAFTAFKAGLTASHAACVARDPCWHDKLGLALDAAGNPLFNKSILQDLHFCEYAQNRMWTTGMNDG